MKTDSQKTNKRIWLGAAISFALLLLATYPNSALAQSNTFPSTGNVGIGTTTPGNLLEINKSQNAGTNLVVDNGYTTDGNAAYSGLWFRQGGANRAFFGSLNAGNTAHTGGPGAVQFWNFVNGPMLFGTNGIEAMRITPDGNLGIGLANPSGQLHVQASAVTKILQSNLASSVGSEVGRYFIYSRGVNNDWGAGMVATIPSGVAGVDTVDLGLYTSQGGSVFSTEKVRIRGNGNVGIGTSTPNRKLEIAGDVSGISLEAGSGSPNSGVIRFGDNTGWKFHFGRSRESAGGALNSGTSGVLMTIQDNGNVGIGTTGTNFKFDVQGGQMNASGGLCIAGDCKTNWSQVASQWVNGSNSISYNSNVGIGTTTPGYKLDVNGTVNASALNINGSPVISSQWSTSGTTINYGGNVGIGTNSPTAQLHVLGVNGPNDNTASPAPDALQVIGGVGGNGNWGGSPGGVGGGINLTGGAGGAPVAGSNAATGGKGGSINLTGGTGGPNSVNVGGGTGGDVLLNGGVGVDNSAGNIILANIRGNVGIGTATPGSAYKLDVQGGKVNAFGGLCINGDCKTNWSQLGGSQWTDGSNSISYSSGNVGIGTATPLVGLMVDKDNGSGYAGWFRKDANSSGVGLGTSGTVAMVQGLTSAGGVDALALQPAGGNVGIGTNTPGSQYKLDVNGNTNVTGNINVSGNINAKYQDVAEWVPASEQIPTGTVVVLDSTKSNQVIASTVSYDTRVAGVISERPGLALGERGDNKVLVATTGRVKVKVDASRAPIHIGDLLVTSDKPGMAQKSEPVNLGGVQLHRPGTLIGKALEPLSKGSGEILVLLSLQ